MRRDWYFLPPHPLTTANGRRGGAARRRRPCSVGGFGGRTDHAGSSIFEAAIRLAKQAFDIDPSGEEEGYPLLPGERTIDPPPGSRFSVVPVTDSFRR